MKTGILVFLLAIAYGSNAQNYPQDYFRSPLNIPMQLVANFGELRANHWHMGLDIRTQQRENLPVHAAADGYISAVSVDATGFGRAIYITHPNGFTTVYGHLNNFEPRLNAWLKAQQYAAQSWAGKWQLTPDQFPVKQGDFIAYSGSTGGSQGPHVHFEIRDTKLEKCLNPLLFHFPIPDTVPPSLLRLALYDRTKSVYAQTPKFFSLKKSGANYTLTVPVLKVSAEKFSFASGVVDRFTGYTNPNGIYSADLSADGILQSRFVLDSISYDETRYENAQIDYRLKASGGSYVQHLSKMPGERSGVYKVEPDNGVLSFSDTLPHAVLIDVFDAAGNKSQLAFNVQYEPNFFKTPSDVAEQLRPNEVNVFERPNFELYTSDAAVYDTIPIAYSEAADASSGSVSAKQVFLNATIPTHDSITVRLKLNRELTNAEKEHVVIVNKAGDKEAVQKATWYDGWVSAKFRQFGSFQAFVDMEPPTVNAPGVGDTINLTHASRLVFNPKDNFKKVKSLRAELDGQWLLLTNDKNLAYIYSFDAYFLPGVHQLRVTATDMEGNVSERTWWVRR